MQQNFGGNRGDVFTQRAEAALVNEVREKHYTMEDILHRNLGNKVVEPVGQEQEPVSKEQEV
jgi:hypothetical protein